MIILQLKTTCINKHVHSYDLMAGHKSVGTGRFLTGATDFF